MSNQRRWDLVVSSKGKNDRTNYSKVGVVFENDKGQLSILIDKGISIGCADGVYVNGYVPKAREDGAQRGGGERTRHSDDTGADDIPF